jgi:hypothetical protein
VTIKDPKSDLREYLQRAREALVWKLDGLSEWDIRRPLVPTGTNLLGLIKHLAGCELVYFGTTFGRPSADELAWSEDDPMSDMFAFPEESRADVIGRSHWMRAAGYRTGTPRPTRSRCTRSCCTSSSILTGTPGTPILSVSSSTGQPGCPKKT